MPTEFVKSSFKRSANSPLSRAVTSTPPMDVNGRKRSKKWHGARWEGPVSVQVWDKKLLGKEVAYG